MTDAADLWNRIVWSRPDVPRPKLCSLCFTLIGEDEVPVMMWSESGAFAQFCEECECEVLQQVKVIKTRKL